jgi:NADH-quinone oxidoreductase subunit F
VRRPGTYEITLGLPMRDLIYDCAGGPLEGRTLKAVIPGGSSVPIMSMAEVDACATDYEGIAANGSLLGSGGMIVMDDSTDLVLQIWRLARFYAHESCAQCTNCREGTAWTARILERILKGEGTASDLDLLLDLADNMTGKTICVLSDSCAAPVVSGLAKFRDEFEAYLSGARTPVLVGG